MGDGQAGKSKNASKERDDSVKPKRTAEQAEPEGKQKEAAPLQKQFLDSLGKSWAVLTGQGGNKQNKGDSTGGPQTAGAPKNAWQELQEWVSNPVHKWDENLMKSSGNSPEQVAKKLSPEVVVSIDSGLKVQAALEKGRSEGSLSAQEKLDLSNYWQFKSTIKNIPLVDQADVQRSLEAAVQQRAQQIRASQPAEAGTNSGGTARTSGQQSVSEPRREGQQAAAGKTEAHSGKAQVAPEIVEGRLPRGETVRVEPAQSRAQANTEATNPIGKSQVAAETAEGRGPRGETVRTEPAHSRVQADAEATNPIKELQEWVTNPVHKWDQTLMKNSGNSPDQVAQKLTPEAVTGINDGMKVQKALENGRSEQSLSAKEKQDLQNYQQFKETLKSVPLVDQNDVRKSLEEAIQKRADQIKQSQPGGGKIAPEAQSKPAGPEQSKKESPATPVAGQGREQGGAREAPAAKPEASSRPPARGTEANAVRQPDNDNQRRAEKIADARTAESAFRPERPQSQNGPQRFLDREMNLARERQKSGGVDPGLTLEPKSKSTVEQVKSGGERPVSAKLSDGRTPDSKLADSKGPLERPAERKPQNDLQSSVKTNDQKPTVERNLNLKVPEQRSSDDRFSAAKRPDVNVPSTPVKDAVRDSKSAQSAAGHSVAPERSAANRPATQSDYNSAKSEQRKVGEAAGQAGEKGPLSSRLYARPEVSQPAELKRQQFASTQLNVSDLARGIKSLQEPVRSSGRAGAEADRNVSPTQLRGSVDLARNVQRLENLARLNQLQSVSGRPLEVVRTLRESPSGRTTTPLADAAVKAVIGRTFLGSDAGRAAAGQTRGVDLAARLGVVSTSRFDPQGALNIREPRGFTSAQRIDRRYILGTELALAAVIAAAGVARRRPEDTANSGRTADKPADRPGDRITDRRPSSLPAGLPSIRETGIGRTMADRQQGLLTSNTRIDRRYIFGTEVALAALIAAGGVSRHRLDKELFGQQAGDKGSGSRSSPAADGRPKSQDSARGPDRPVVKDAEFKSFTTVAKVGDKRFVTGAEIALAAILSAAGVSKLNAAAESPAERLPVQNETPQAESPERIGDQSADFRQASDRMQSQGGDRQKAVASDFPELKDSQDDEQPEEYERLIENLAKNVSQTDDENAVQRKVVLHRPTTIISARDTLISVAEAFFHDPNLAWLIADLNLQNVRESWIDGKRVIELRSRQQIELPVWADIEAFYSSRKAEAQPENLVTIIEETQIDRELLSSALGTAMGVSSSGPGPFAQPQFNAPAVANQPTDRQFRWLFKRFLTNSP